MNSVRNSYSKQCPKSRLGWVHKVHTQRTLAARTLHPGRAHTVPRLRAQRRVVGLLGPVTRTADRNVVVPGHVGPPSWRAQACVPAQPTVCLLSLLCVYSAGCVPAQPAVCLLRLLCACSACCVPAQPVVCLLSLLCACSSCCVLAQPVMCLLSLLCACSGCCVLAQPVVCLLSLLCACSACCEPQYS